MKGMMMAMTPNVRDGLILKVRECCDGWETSAAETAIAAVRFAALAIGPERMIEARVCVARLDTANQIRDQIEACIHEIYKSQGGL
jgi:hypothetical protein